jgi:hypothetical protein
MRTIFSRWEFLTIAGIEALFKNIRWDEVEARLK